MLKNKQTNAGWITKYRKEKCDLFSVLHIKLRIVG